VQSGDDDDDDDVMDMTSQKVRRQLPVMHRERSDAGGQQLYAGGGVTSYGHRGWGGTGIAALPQRLPETLERSRDPQESSIYGLSSVNDVTVLSADYSRGYFPTPINQPPAMTVDRYQLERRNQLVSLPLLHNGAKTTTTNLNNNNYYYYYYYYYY